MDVPDVETVLKRVRESKTAYLSRARVSEILNRKRSLSINMIRNLQEGLGISAEILIKPYALNTAELNINADQATH